MINENDTTIKGITAETSNYLKMSLWLPNMTPFISRQSKVNIQSLPLINVQRRTIWWASFTFDEVDASSRVI